MTSHLDSVVRISMLLGFALLAMPILRSRSAVVRRLVLSVALAAVLVVPFVPAWHVDVPAVHALVGRLAVDRVAPVASVGPSAVPIAVVAHAIDWLALAWALGAAAVAARFAIGLVLARRLVARASEAPPAWAAAVARAERTTGLRAVVRVSPEIEAPAVAGIVSPTILVPMSSASWTETRRTAVLLHELAHVAAYDLAVQALVAIACSLHWFNPLVWLAARRLRVERELAADEAVIRSGVRASSYAEDLLAIAGSAPVGTIAIGEKPLPARIAAIVAERRPAFLGREGAAVVVFGTAVVALGVACTTTASSEPAPIRSVASADHELQAFAETELDHAVSQWKAGGGTILVMTPKGEVLADVGGRTDEPYVTGSTMKSILLAAAIDEGRVTEADVFVGAASKVDALYDATPLVRAALPELLAVSSNEGFAQVFDRLGGARYDRTLRRFHFAPPPELSTEPPGDVKGQLTAIGATMTATPRQVALAYAALANGGDGIVKADTAARVTTLLEGVVASEHGTGKAARVAGTRVAGKTGTSEWTGTDGNPRTYASFVGYLPADHPRYVVFIGIDTAAAPGAWGGAAAAPVFARVASRALAR